MQNARRAHKIRLCGHLRRYKKIVKKTYIISYNSFVVNSSNVFAKNSIYISRFQIHIFRYFTSYKSISYSESNLSSKIFRLLINISVTL